MLETTDQTFAAEVEQASGPVLVDFHAPWCGPCQALRPVLAQLDQRRPDLKIVGVDYDRSPQIALRYGVRALPTLILFRDGKAVGQRAGNVPASLAELERMIDGTLTSP